MQAFIKNHLNFFIFSRGTLLTENTVVRCDIVAAVVLAAESRSYQASVIFKKLLVYLQTFQCFVL